MIYSWLFNWLLGYNARRKRLLNKAPEGPMRNFLATPFPSPREFIKDTPILAVDFETTGLDAQKDKLLSVGFVGIQHNQIKLSSQFHQIINTAGNLDASNVVIHQITDDTKARGHELKPVVDSLLNALAGKVMLVHFSRIEKTFFAQACLEIYGMTPMFPIIDTLSIAKNRYDKKGIAFAPSQLRLSPLRESYQLPAHHAHNALNDAVATAELFLAQVNQLPEGKRARLKAVLQ